MAVMIALPWPTAVTRPSDETVATASSDELQTASPAPSGATVAVSWTVSPTLVIVKVAGDTVTDCTSHVTVTWHVALLPPAVAVTVAVPLFTPVTNPFSDTVATCVSEELHDTFFSVASLGVTSACS